MASNNSYKIEDIIRQRIRKEFKITSSFWQYYSNKIYLKIYNSFASPYVKNFLIENNLLDKVINNICKDRGIKPQTKDFEFLLKICETNGVSITNVLNHFFPWSDTEEGDFFWSEMTKSLLNMLAEIVGRRIKHE